MAFLEAMLYGIDSSARMKGGVLPEDTEALKKQRIADIEAYLGDIDENYKIQVNLINLAY